MPALAWLANSRALHPCDGSSFDALEQARQAASRPGGLPPWAEVEALRSGDIVVDATASETVADWHAEWLSRGVHAVSYTHLDVYKRQPLFRGPDGKGIQFIAGLVGGNPGFLDHRVDAGSGCRNLWG